MPADILAFIPHDATFNMDTGDGFTCAACGHWTYEGETEWGDYFACEPKRFGGHIHGTEPFRFCPHCGAPILTLEEWVEHYPEDQGKMTGQIVTERFGATYD